MPGSGPGAVVSTDAADFQPFMAAIKTLSSLNRHAKPQMVSGKVLSVMWACVDMCVTDYSSWVR